MYFNNHEFGFSLIELMIVVAIISILATIAIPSYRHYVERARFAEVIAATEPFKIAVSLALQQNVPANDLVNGKYGIPNQYKKTKNVENITVKNGIITALATKLLNNHSYILKPDENGTYWTISGTCLKDSLCSD